MTRLPPLPLDGAATAPTPPAPGPPPPRGPGGGTRGARGRPSTQPGGGGPPPATARAGGDESRRAEERQSEQRGRPRTSTEPGPRPPGDGLITTGQRGDEAPVHGVADLDRQRLRRRVVGRRAELSERVQPPTVQSARTDPAGVPATRRDGAPVGGGADPGRHGARCGGPVTDRARVVGAPAEELAGADAAAACGARRDGRPVGGVADQSRSRGPSAR